jgi:hypothetical protein
MARTPAEPLAFAEMPGSTYALTRVATDSASEERLFLAKGGVAMELRLRQGSAREPAFGGRSIPPAGL